MLRLLLRELHFARQGVENSPSFYKTVQRNNEREKSICFWEIMEDELVLGKNSIVEEEEG